ncbi:MAG: hypothetical protein H6735_00110 [Alphaproteobacteria bacterium]|nr:hypothetical protein [Alphaproteobacteria bacterium]
MGSSFVDIDGRGFWVQDGILELWLRLLALHLEEPGLDQRRGSPVLKTRDQWLLISKVHFNGCVPVCLGEAVQDDEGRRVVMAGIRSLITALRRAPPVLDRGPLNLLGHQNGGWNDIETSKLLEIGEAFLDLVERGIGADASSARMLPAPTRSS